MANKNIKFSPASVRLLKQYGLGSWLGENAGTIGTVLGAGLGTIIAPGIGTSLGASLGSSIGGAVQSNVTQNNAQEEALKNQQLQMSRQNAVNNLQMQNLPNYGATFALGGYIPKIEPFMFSNVNGKLNYASGGSLNFKSPAAYKAWLGYVHATGVAESTPGNQKVSIKGQPHKVQHAFGGPIDDELLDIKAPSDTVYNFVKGDEAYYKSQNPGKTTFRQESTGNDIPAWQYFMEEDVNKTKRWNDPDYRSRRLRNVAGITFEVEDPKEIEERIRNTRIYNANNPGSTVATFNADRTYQNEQALKAYKNMWNEFTSYAKDPSWGFEGALKEFPDIKNVLKTKEDFIRLKNLAGDTEFDTDYFDNKKLAFGGQIGLGKFNTGMLDSFKCGGKMYAGGGLMETSGGMDNVTMYNGGYTHEASPVGGTKIGNKGLVEKGEVRYGDYIFSDRF